MDTKRIERFFKQTDLLRMIGGAMAIIGLAWFYFGHSAVSYYVPIFLMPVGLVMFIVCSARAVPESELRQSIDRALHGLGSDVTETNIAQRVLKNPEPFCAEGEYFTEYATAFRRGKDSKVLSDAYCRTMLYFTADALLVRGRRVEMSSGKTEDTSLRIEWRELTDARIKPFEARVKLTNTKNTFAGVKGAYLQLVGEQGEILYAAPIRNDLNADQLCANIVRKCEETARSTTR